MITDTLTVSSFAGEDISLRYTEAGPADGVAVVLCHGFPDLGRTWAPQQAALAAAGFRAIAPDQRGYGGSSTPTDAAAYDLGQLTGDMAGLLDALDIERAVFVGHDWGGQVAWGMPVLHPDRCLGAAGVCTPYMAFPTTALLSQLFLKPERMYMLWFQTPGVAEAFLDDHTQMVFEKLFVGGTDPAVLMERFLAEPGADTDGPDMNPFLGIESLESIGEPLLGPDEVAAYTEAFARSGFHGPVSWYRNLDRNAELFGGVGVAPLGLPTLMICAEWDPVLSPAMAAGMPDLCSDLEMHTVERAGHFVQIENPGAVSELLVDWLSRRFG